MEKDVSDFDEKSETENVNNRVRAERYLEVMKKDKINVFLSYCRADSNIADKVCQYFGDRDDIKIHRDIKELNNWDSIKAYMNLIDKAECAVLLLSEAYLKSQNCMYEVLEVMRNAEYREKIFPVVIERKIYTSIGRARYVRYWKEEFNALRNELSGLEPYELGRLGEDLKRIQEIKTNIADFLDAVADMNNPQIESACLAIEKKLDCL